MDAGKMLTVERCHWQATLVGQLDAAFNLSETEQVHCYALIGHLLDQLRIPARGPANQLPLDVALEAESGFWTRQLTSAADAGLVRSPHRRNPRTEVISLEVWRATLANVITVAYPALNPIERLALHKTLTDILVALAIEDRAPNYVPESVVRAGIDP